MKGRFRCIFLLVFMGMLTVKGMDSRYYFRHLGIDEGMSQNSVMCILQDRKGFMWFGTKDGINRYDGIRFKTILPDDQKTNLGNCIINAICETRDGKIWAGTDMGVSVYDPATEKFRVFDRKTKENESVIHRVRDICEDTDGKVWIADEVMGIFSYDPETGELLRHRTEGMDFVKVPAALYVDKGGILWVGTGYSGFYYYDPITKYFRPFRCESSDFSDMEIMSILEAGQDLYIGTLNRGVWKINRETLQLSPLIKDDEQGHPLHIRRMIRVAPNEVWIGGEGGIYIYHETTNRFTHLKQSYTDKFALSDHAIYSFYRDKEGGMWVGTYFGGVNYMPFQYTPFQKYYPLNDGKSVSGKAVREFCEDEDGYIWIGTEDAGLNRFDPRTGEFKHFRAGSGGSIHYDNVHALQMDKEGLWIGTYTGGLDFLNVKTHQVKHYPVSKAPAEVFSFLKDRSGRKWLGSFLGVYLYDAASDRFRRVEELGRYFIYDIKEDHKGNIWFAAMQLGVIRYNPVSGEIVRFAHDRNDKQSVSAKIIGIFEDSRQRLWFTSEGEGFCRFDPQTETFIHYTTQEGLPNDVVYYMTEDLNGILWLGTNRGLVAFNPGNEEMKIYTRENGLLCDQFNYKSAFTAKDGTVYMGSINGFISFDPSQFKENTAIFPPILTGFQIFNAEVPIGESSPLSESISQTRKLKLKYNQNTLSFDFASLNYNAPEMCYYTYKLEGFDNEWIFLKQNQKITYSNLPPGKYVLYIKSLPGNEEGCKLAVEIVPPFYLSVYAYLFYTLIVLLGSWAAIRLIAIRIKEKHRRSVMRLEREKEKEVYDAKIVFFTNIAHEVRTPLSLIKGPLEHILKENQIDNKIREDLNIMQRNTDRLLSLINQLLDFRKTESGKFSLTFVRQDVFALMRDVCERFIPLFRQRNLDFKMNLPEEKFFADVDGEAFCKIWSNLLDNASKFAYTCIEVEFGAGLNHFRIYIKNDGKIVREEMFEKIFEPFYQLHEKDGENARRGTGMGLPLARSLSELHNGKLFLEKQSSDFNTFVLELPVHQDNVVCLTEEVKPLGVSGNFCQERKTDKYAVLIVEDNAEMQDFISKQLDSLYTVYRKSNGKDALELLDKEHVDVIVSDIVMPEMDGFELLKNVKSDIRNSHIPVILLTARTNLQAKIEGLERGADAYIEKPFSMDHLLVQMNNLLEGRKKLRDTYIRSPYLHSNTIALTKADEVFMEKLHALVEQNMENTEFNIDLLAGMMNMSRSSLLRKIKGISELTANEYIRLVRLKKAALLLEEGRYRINEICFLTGFSSSSYFAKCFQKQFGMLPKDFEHICKERKEASTKPEKEK